jgi:hypothetical protein
MNNRKMTCGLLAFYAVVAFIVGCIPENSLQWCQDGSVGLLRAEGELGLVDGKTGELTMVAEDVGLWPDISKDGNLIAYSEKVNCDNLSEGLKLLPPGQVKMIQYCAEQMRKDILDGHGRTSDKVPFPAPEEGPLVPNDYRNWAIRYLCENADSELLETLGNEAITKGKEETISYFQVVVVSRENLTKKRVVTANVFTTMATRLSPDGKSVAYLMHTQEGQVSNAFEEYGLYVASLETDVKAMLVDHPLAIGYDWREDGRAIAYLSADSKDLPHDNAILGTLNEKTVADANGSLLAEPMQLPERGSAATHHCIGGTAQLVGTVFYPWWKVEYGLDNRIFFSSFALPLPASKRDEPACSLFCYDPVTAAVADALPLSVSSQTSQQVFGISQFALSPDGRFVLLPIAHNRFIVYELGTDSMEMPIPEEEGFGEEELPELAPSWKGSSEVSFLVSENSHFLPKAKEGEEKPARKEIVVLRRTDGQSRILSENWPESL